MTRSVDGAGAPAHPGAPVRSGGTVVGTVTSGAMGHRTGLDLALAVVAPGLAAPGTRVAVDVIGAPRPAVVIPPSPCDPGFERVRS